MKLITLNTWSGKVAQPLREFFAKYGDVDIFCLQEMTDDSDNKDIPEGFYNYPDEIIKDLYQEVQVLLPNHQPFFCHTVGEFYGLACFVKKDIKVSGEGELSLYQDPSDLGLDDPDTDHDRKMQWLMIEKSSIEYLIMNIHGHWTGAGKSDTTERIIQSERIKDFMKNIKAPKVLAGDFNLRPDTQSMAILEDSLINLISTYNITSTRTSFYTKAEKFADYILVSPDILVKEFKVLLDEVSDHAPLFIEFGV